LVSVHDCFGTVAPHFGGLNASIREQFVQLHKLDLLNRVRESAKHDLPKHVKLPSTPEIGNLDIERVLFTIHSFK
jgi:DNA-directed RNA polymerase